jgi:4-diphosphocytidyl-2-C-methyl-D-erythritol kinase
MLTVYAPAKVNLTLEVLGKRGDGFHEIRSVIQTISLCDRLGFKQADNLVFNCDQSGWRAQESLIPRAASLLKATSGYTRGAVIEVGKRIPLLSGLGGDSSDAAAVLRGLNRLWDLALSPGELARLASKLGSDVTFFLSGGTALAQGRGEFVSPLPQLPHSWMVLLVPAVRLANKTQRLYASLKESHHTQGEATDELVGRLTRGEQVAPGSLFNVFEAVAYGIFSGLDDCRRRFLQAGAESVHLAGSGPTLFTLVKNQAEAEKIHCNLQKQGLECYLAETLEAVLPLE